MATSVNKGRQSAGSPYCVFRNDRDRLWALVSRDVRLVLIAGIMVMSSTSIPWSKFGAIFLTAW